MADAAVWITGTGQNKQLNFRLPTGGKGDKGDKGDPGLNGSNVLPTDTAIKEAINNSGSHTRGALDSRYAKIQGGGYVADAATLEYFGAVGDGTTDDTAAFTTAFTAAEARYLGTGSQTTVYGRPGATYKVSGNSNGAIRPKSGVILDLRGARVITGPTGANGAIIGVNSGVNLAAPIALSADALAWQSVFTVASAPAGGWVAGSYVLLTSTGVVSGGCSTTTRAQFARVLSASGSGPYTVTLEEVLTEDFTTAHSATVTPNVPAVKDFALRNGVLDFTSASAENVLRAAYFRFLVNSEVSNITVKGIGNTSGPGISVYDSLDTQVIDVKASDLSPGEKIGLSSGFNGYGVLVGGCSKRVNVTRAKGIRVRHAQTTLYGPSGGQPEWVTFDNCEARSCSRSGLDTHPDGRWVTFINPVGIGNDAAGLQNRSFGTTVIGGTLSGNSSYGLFDNSPVPTLSSFKDFTSENNGWGGGGTAGVSLAAGSVLKDVTSRDNRRAVSITATGSARLTRIVGGHAHVTGAGASAIEISGSVPSLEIDGLTIERAGTGMSGILGASDGHVFRNVNWVNFPVAAQSRLGGQTTRGWAVLTAERAGGAPERVAWRYSVNIADDAVKSYAVAKKTGRGFLFVEATSGVSQFSGAFDYDLDAGTITVVSVPGVGANFAVLAATALTGTSGTDGNVTVGVSGGKLYVENRSAAARDISVQLQ